MGVIPTSPYSSIGTRQSPVCNTHIVTLTDVDEQIAPIEAANEADIAATECGSAHG